MRFCSGKRTNQNFEMTFSVFIFFSPFLFLLVLSFCRSCLPTAGLVSTLRISENASSSFQLLTPELPNVVGQGNFSPRCLLKFPTIFQSQLTQSLSSGYHWNDLVLLQNLKVNNANFGQRWWRQKQNKGQRSSLPVTVGTGLTTWCRHYLPYLVTTRAFECQFCLQLVSIHFACGQSRCWVC